MHLGVLSIVLNKGRYLDHELIFPGKNSLIFARLVRTPFWLYVAFKFEVSASSSPVPIFEFVAPSAEGIGPSIAKATFRKMYTIAE